MAMIENFDDELSRSDFHGLLAMQRPEVKDAFDVFIKEEAPTLVIEIGTAFGGLALALYHICTPLGIKFITFDPFPNGYSNTLPEQGVDFRTEDIFIPQNKWQHFELKPYFLEEFNSYPSPRMILCDGGNKVAEFNGFAKHLRPGDILMAHDFAMDKKRYLHNLKEGIWAWKEIEHEYIKDSLAKFNLSYYRMTLWENLAWACTKKIL